MNARKKVFVSILLILTVSLLFSSAVLAQEEGGGFTEEFDSINWEGWEHSQDITVENGVLILDPGNFVIRFGEWSEIDLDLRLRLQPPGDVVINYYLREESQYSLQLSGQELLFWRVVGGEPILRGSAQIRNMPVEEWNDVNIRVTGETHTITINQQEVFTATDPESLTGGAIMIHAVGEGAVEVDSISLTGISSGPPPEGDEPGGEPPPPEGEGQPEEGGMSVPPVQTTQEAGSTEPESLLEAFMAGQGNQLELTDFLINLVLAVISAFILGRVYVHWGSSLSNRRSFAANFMLLTVTTTFIILVVRSSVALSLGLVGALSIVRFRAAVKEPEELAYLFFAISLGIGLGDNQRLITLLALLVGIAVIGLLRLFRSTGSDVNLHLTISSKNPSKIDLDQLTAVLEKHCSKIKLLRMDETPEVLESSFVIEFKRVSDLSAAKAELQALSPELQISFLDNKGIW